MTELLAKLDAFKAKWPNDYRQRIGYMSTLEKIAELARKLCLLEVTK